MLQRVYGTAFATEKELQEHLARIDEAKSRDHRRVGAALDLFFTDRISPGSPFYLPKGVVVYNGLIDYIRSLYPRYGFSEIDRGGKTSAARAVRSYEFRVAEGAHSRLPVLLEPRPGCVGSWA